jgi:hypothetical protein
MEELGVINKPECIYNLDEKGCSFLPSQTSAVYMIYRNVD